MKSQVGKIHIPDTLISLMTCFMGMIAPWDSLGIDCELSVAADVEDILSPSLFWFSSRRPDSLTDDVKQNQ